MSKQNNQCSKCQTKIYDKSGKQFFWFTNEKHGNVCSSCLEELDKKGELWDNFFKNTSYNYVPGATDPGMENGLACNFCREIMLERQLHQHDKNSKKLTLNHNCQAKCNPLETWSDCKKNETFPLTQAYLDWMKKYDYSWGNGLCPKCRIGEVKRDISFAKGLNKQKETKLKEALQELENIISGKEDNSQRERERERERAELRKEIADLEAITNRTPEQEQKLQELRDKLAKLEQDNQGGDPKEPTNYWLWIGLGALLVIVIGIIIYLLTKNEKKEN